MIIDNLQQIITLAKSLREKIVTGYVDTEEVLAILELIKRVDLEQEYAAGKRDMPASIIRKTKIIFLLADRAYQEIISKHYVPDNVITILDKIVELEHEIQKDVVIIPIVPTSEIKRILSYSAREAYSRGFLFRGVSAEDYARVMLSESIFAADPNGHVNLLKHILDSTNNPRTQFISLTSDVSKAEHFGRVIIIRKDQLLGHLYTPVEIEAILRKETRGTEWSKAKKLQLKNTEFILGPSRSEVARIPASAVIRRAA
ncbi:hypothetical protein J4444_03880 [Candidatus Woesearchaeota archaeon]|nr:hypothetical protein [Candidatus Woesearchaeota archaeon]